MSRFGCWAWVFAEGKGKGKGKRERERQKGKEKAKRKKAIQKENIEKGKETGKGREGGGAQFSELLTLGSTCSTVRYVCCLIL